MRLQHCWPTHAAAPTSLPLCPRDKDDSTTQAALGFKICGMQVGGWDNVLGGWNRVLGGWNMVLGGWNRVLGGRDRVLGGWNRAL